MNILFSSLGKSRSHLSWALALLPAAGAVPAVQQNVAVAGALGAGGGTEIPVHNKMRLWINPGPAVQSEHFRVMSQAPNITRLT